MQRLLEKNNNDDAKGADDASKSCGCCGIRDAKSRCSRCHVRRYCCRECQLKDWPRHRSKCREMADAAAAATAAKKKTASKDKEDKIQVISE